jgi:signal transduction histidine kinase
VDDPEAGAGGRAESLAALHDATRELMAAEDHEAVALVAVDTAVEVLGQPYTSAFLFDPATGTLRSAANSAAASETFGEPPTFAPGEGLVGTAFETGEFVAPVDPRSDERALEDGSPAIRSFLALPLADHGVLTIGSPTTDALEDADVDLARVLAANVEAALDRADREASRRERERELARKNERLEEFASVVSHDLRNPLNVARGHVTTVRDRQDDGHLATAVDALDRMDALLDDLLELARQGDDVEDPAPVALDAVARDAWAAVETGDLSLSADVGGAVIADRSRLAQLFENCFGNVATHATGASTVRVVAFPDGFAVEDDGRGVPPDDRGRVFEPGYSTARDGTGLGLRIVGDVADAHGWDVALVESADGGARLEFTGVSLA